MTIEEEIAWKIRNDCGKYIREGRSIAATIMPVVRRAQAEALREAAGLYIAEVIQGAGVMTPVEWLRLRADRIEQGDGFMSGPSEAAGQHLQEWRATREQNSEGNET